MKLELKNVKIAASLSQETLAYTATLYVDGVKAAHMENHGHGAADSIHWINRELGMKVQAWAQTQERDPRFPELAVDVEMLVHRLLETYEEERQLRRWCKKWIVFQLPGDGDAWRKMLTLDRAKAVKAIEQKYPGQQYTILNDRFQTA